MTRLTIEFGYPPCGRGQCNGDFVVIMCADCKKVLATAAVMQNGVEAGSFTFDAKAYYDIVDHPKSCAGLSLGLEFSQRAS